MKSQKVVFSAKTLQYTDGGMLKPKPGQLYLHTVVQCMLRNSCAVFVARDKLHNFCPIHFHKTLTEQKLRAEHVGPRELQYIYSQWKR